MNISLSSLTPCLYFVRDTFSDALHLLQKKVTIVALACLSCCSILSYLIYHHYFFKARRINENQNIDENKERNLQNQTTNAETDNENKYQTEFVPIPVIAKPAAHENPDRSNIQDAVEELQRYSEDDPLPPQDLFVNQIKEGMADVQKGLENLETDNENQYQTEFVPIPVIAKPAAQENPDRNTIQEAVEELKRYSEDDPLPPQDLFVNQIKEGMADVRKGLENLKQILKQNPNNRLQNILKRLEKNRSAAFDQQKNEELKQFKFQTGNILDRCRGKLIQKEIKEFGDRQIGIASWEGLRESMEDTFLAEQFSFQADGQTYQAELFGIFDGHGGVLASTFVRDNIRTCLSNAISNNGLGTVAIWDALKEAFIKLNDDFTGYVGTTAIIGLLLPKDDKDKEGELWIANAGDSRAVLLLQDGTIFQASEDAKPEIERYEKKINSLGGSVIFDKDDEIFRVNGFLATARAIGDQNIIGMSPKPKISSYPLEALKNGHLVLGSDGLFDVASSFEVGEAINLMASQNQSSEEMASRLVYSVSKSSPSNFRHDNTTVIVVKL